MRAFVGCQLEELPDFDAWHFEYSPVFGEINGQLQQPSDFLEASNWFRFSNFFHDGVPGSLHQ